MIRVFLGSSGYDVAYRIERNRILSGSGGGSSESEEKPGCLGTIIGIIIGGISSIIMRYLKTWPGRIGVAYGLACGILPAIGRRGGIGMDTIINSIMFPLICGALGLLGGFISSKLSRHGNFGALIGAAVIGIAVAGMAASHNEALPGILLLFLFGVVPGLVAGAIIGSIVGGIAGLVKKQINKKK